MLINDVLTLTKSYNNYTVLSISKSLSSLHILHSVPSVLDNWL